MLLADLLFKSSAQANLLKTSMQVSINLYPSLNSLSADKSANNRFPIDYRLYSHIYDFVETLFWQIYAKNKNLTRKAIA